MKNKFLILCVIIVASTANIFSQADVNSSFSAFLNEYRISSQEESHFNALIKDYDLIKINNLYHIGVGAIINENELDRATFTELEVINDTRLDNLWTLRVPIKNLEALRNVEGINYLEIGEPVSPLLELAVPSSRADSVHAGLGGLSRPYTGKDVVVAIIDWGFDYTHPVFYDTALNHLRIVRAWDQNKLSGPHPEGFSFGTEYVGQEELLAAGRDTNYVFGYSSHGTHVGGIAGGAGGGTEFGGVAFESDLIFISLRRDAPSLIDAFSYVTNYAAKVGKPYVVNMSFGSHLGPHDGTSLKNLGIDILNGPGKVFVGSAGNNGESSGAFHLDYDFLENSGDTLKTVVGSLDILDSFGQTLSMWGSANSDFAVSLAYVYGFDSIAYQTPFYSSLNEPLLNDTITIGEDSMIIRIQSTAKHFLNDKPNIRLEVKNAGSGKVVLMATSENSHLHIWNNVRMNNRYTNWGVDLSSTFPGATNGNHEYACGEPGGVGRNVITVGSYRSERIIDGTILLGQASQFSSMGPTVDNRVKPDISSTGHQVISSVNSFNATETGFSGSVVFNDSTYNFKAYSGTSMSGPTVTGIVALMLEANPKMSATEVKEVLKTTARLDQHTGEIGPEGDLKWGWGKANALAAVKAAETIYNVPDTELIRSLFNIYPNPANDNITIKTNKSENILKINIFSADGKSVMQVDNLNNISANINISNLPSGTYLIKLSTESNFSFERLVVTK